VRDHTGLQKRRRSFRSCLLVFGIAFATAVTIGLTTWAFVGPASAHPGLTCNPAPGHGTPGCHVDATTTTAKPTTTTAKPTTTTAKPTTTTAKAGTATTAKPTTTSTKASTATTKAGTGTTGAATSTTALGASTTTASTSTTTASSTSTTSATAGSAPTTGSPASTASPEAPVDSTTPQYSDASNCLSCHGDPSLTKKLADGTTVSLYVNAANLPQAAHRYQDCTSCHTDKPHEVQTPLTKLSQAEKCGSCHQYEYDQYIESVHGVPMAGGNTDPATCADCHSTDGNPHSVVRVLDPAASTYPKNIAQTCAKCHNDPALMDKYGIVEKVYDSYMRSFHGKAIKLSPQNATIQQLDTATCVNCHGAHNIKSVTDPASSVAGMDNLVKTCKGCHPQAGPQFVSGFLGHKVASSTKLPQVYWGGMIFSVLSRVMLAGGLMVMATSVGLRGVPWLRRKVKGDKKREE
jgi:hypothetical protein